MIKYDTLSITKQYTSTLQYKTVECIKLQLSKAVQYSTDQYNTVKYSTVLFRIVQHSKHYNIVQLKYR